MSIPAWILFALQGSVLLSYRFYTLPHLKNEFELHFTEPTHPSHRNVFWAGYVLLLTIVSALVISYILNGPEGIRGAILCYAEAIALGILTESFVDMVRYYEIPKRKGEETRFYQLTGVFALSFALFWVVIYCMIATIYLGVYKVI